MTSASNSKPDRAEPPAIEPALPIVDCHHHLWHPHADRYLVDAFQKDILASGHAVAATVYVEASVMFRQSGPEALRTIGEAEFVAGMAAMSDSGLFGPSRICAGYVAAADLTLGDEVDDVLDALQAASGGRLRGIRGSAVWDADASVNTGTRPFAPRDLLQGARYRAAVARMTKRGLVYDAWQYYPQLPDVCSLADALPQATIVVNHCGGLLGIGPYARAGNFERWRGLIVETAKRPNIRMKIGGLAGSRTGFGYAERVTPPTASDLVSDWQPYVESCIEAFGADRCMFESNFPVDAIAGSYGTLWNVFKTIAAGASPDEKHALFSGNAMQIYGIA
jgi:predicted TIM-barrel fold metal-dependent hydrolase